jgi:aminomethyltransferase
LCESHEWRNWSGYLAASTYEATHEREYYSIRNSAALIDVSPLFKYEVSGPDALRLVNRVMTRDVRTCKVGQVMYTAWCDQDGKLIDDGTIARLDDRRFRITAADPSLRWFQDVGYGMNASVTDVSQDLAALALQGPNARNILQAVVNDIDFDQLKYFHWAHGNADGFPLTVTRTGYTGDLGYELWVEPKHAVRLYEILLDKGKGYGVTPAGMLALDIARIEAGLILIEIDYISSVKALIASQHSSPYEVGLGWTVKLNQGNDFVGRKALLRERTRGARRLLVGLEVRWTDLEKLFGKVDLPPQVAGRASRDPVPVYKDGKQIGQATSRTFSPLLKKYIGLAMIDSRYAAPGLQVDVEMTVEYHRKRASATVVPLPFFNPERKRA